MPDEAKPITPRDPEAFNFGRQGDNATPLVPAEEPLPTWAEEYGDDDGQPFDFSQLADVADEADEPDDLDAGADEPDDEPAPAPEPSAPPQQPLDEGRIANAVVNAFRQLHTEHQRAQPRQVQVPQFPELDYDDALTDPKKFRSALQQAAAWGAEAAIQQVSPHIEYANAQLQHIGAARSTVERMARAEARAELIRTGDAADETEADALLNAADQTHMRDERMLPYRLNPEAWYGAAQDVRRSGKVPVKKVAKPTAKNDGDSARERKTKVSTEAARGLKWVEKVLPGAKFTRNDVTEATKLIQGINR